MQEVGPALVVSQSAVAHRMQKWTLPMARPQRAVRFRKRRPEHPGGVPPVDRKGRSEARDVDREAPATRGRAADRAVTELVGCGVWLFSVKDTAPQRQDPESMSGIELSGLV